MVWGRKRVGKLSAGFIHGRVNAELRAEERIDAADKCRGGVP